MASQQPIRKNRDYIFYAALVSQADTKKMQANPTIAAGDFKVSTDGGTLANMTTLPVVTPASSVLVKFTVAAAEMLGDNIEIVCIDAAGAQWCDAVFSIQTIDDAPCVSTVGSGSTTTSVVSSAMYPAGAALDQFKGRIIVFDQNTTTTALRGQATDITGSSNAAAPTFTVSALSTAPVSGDTFKVY